MDELWFRAQNPVLKSLLFGQFSLVIALPVVLRGVVADGEARPLGVVVHDISFNGLFEVGDSPAPVYLELRIEFFLDPAVQSFIDGVVRGLPGPGHGADDVRVFDKVVIGHGGVYAALVRMQDNRFQIAFEQSDDVFEAIDIRVSGATSVCHLPGEYLLGEHIEVEGHFKVPVVVDLDNGHIGYDDLSGTVHCLPGGEDKVGISVLYLSGLIMHLMLGLRFDAEILIALVGVVVADDYLHVDTDVCCRPAVAVSGMFFMDLFHQSDDLFALGIARGWLTVLPLVVPGPAHAH